MATAASQITDAASGRSGRKGPSAASFKKLLADNEAKEAKLERIRNSMKTVKANSGKAAIAVVNVGESVAAGGLSSVISGAAGKHRKWVRGLRAFTALALGGWGVARTLTGKSGSHQLAISGGLATAEAVEVGYDWGRKLNADKGWFAIEGVIAGSSTQVGAAPEIAVTPGGGGGSGGGVRELMPAHPDLEEFRSRARSMSMAS